MTAPPTSTDHIPNLAIHSTVTARYPASAGRSPNLAVDGLGASGGSARFAYL